MNLGLRVPGGATPPLASCAPPLPGIQGPHGHPCWLSCPSHLTTAPHSFSPWCLATRTAARAHHRAVGSVLWASLEGSIPCQHVVLTAPEGLVRTLGALGPPQQIVGREGLVWIQAGLGGEMARQPLEPVSPGPTGAYPLCSSVPMCACVCEIRRAIDPVLGQPWPQATVKRPGSPRFIHSLEPVALEGAGRWENLVLCQPL